MNLIIDPLYYIQVLPLSLSSWMHRSVVGLEYLEGTGHTFVRVPSSNILPKYSYFIDTTSKMAGYYICSFRNSFSVITLLVLSYRCFSSTEASRQKDCELYSCLLESPPGICIETICRQQIMPRGIFWDSLEF